MITRVDKTTIYLPAELLLPVATDRRDFEIVARETGLTIPPSYA